MKLKKKEDLKMGKHLKMFFDLEFTGLTQDAKIISLGIISESGDQFYAENTNIRLADFNSFTSKHILPYLDNKDSIIHGKVMDKNILHTISIDNNNNKTICYGSLGWIKSSLETFLQNQLNTHHKEKAEFWGDCLAYDWVLLCELWGGALSIPDYIYYIPFDICTMFLDKGIDPDTNRELYSLDTYDENKIQKHNALFDAMIIKKCYEKLFLI